MTYDKLRKSTPAEGSGMMIRIRTFVSASMKPRVLFRDGLTLTLLVLTASLSMGQESVPGVVKKIGPSTVAVRIYDRGGEVVGQGTGFFVSKTGDVITNYHVLQNADYADVKTNEGNVYPVRKILAEDREGDLIRISVDTFGDAAPPASIAKTVPEVGEHVVVFGSPLGLEKTVSDGIISAVREIPGFGNIMQVTAPISPGSSGSPVVNMNGEVVGIISFFVAPGQNLNFAIPGQRIAKLAPQDGMTLIDWAEVRRQESAALVVELYASGMRYLLLEDYDRALLFFGEVIKKNPNYAKAYFQMGYCKARLGQYPEAVEAYQESIRLKPDEADAYNNLCTTYGALDRVEDALTACQQALRLQPDLAEAHNNLAWIYYRLGKYSESVVSSKEALRLKPDYALAYYNLGNGYSALGRYQEAVDAYKQGIRFNPDHPGSHINLGAAYHQLGQYQKALESYKEAVRLKPDTGEAHLDLGMTYLRLGDRGSALEEYKILMKLDKESANKLFNLIYE
jgi:tetratricopeptide (TPR) repeat protein